MSVPKLALLAVSAVAALVAALWLQRDDVAMREMQERAPVVAALTTAASDAPASVSPAPQAPVAAAAPPPAVPVAMRATDAELHARAVDESYARVGSALVEHVSASGLAQADGERIVRRFLEDSLRCLFDALRVEAGGQSVAYDSVLDAIEADLYDTDGPLLGAVIDMRPVENRVIPCALTAAQQAGIEPSAFSEATRAAIIRRAR
jgi:hypothetical protein